jgi:hypothetical protein
VRAAKATRAQTAVLEGAHHFEVCSRETVLEKTEGERLRARMSSRRSEADTGDVEAGFAIAGDKVEYEAVSFRRAIYASIDVRKSCTDQGIFRGDSALLMDSELSYR